MSTWLLEQERGWGRVVIQQHWHDPVKVRGSVEILRADPRVGISAELLRQVDDGDIPCISRADDVLTLTDDYGHRYIYRLTGVTGHAPDGTVFAYEMEWPD